MEGTGREEETLNFLLMISTLFSVYYRLGSSILTGRGDVCVCVEIRETKTNKKWLSEYYHRPVPLSYRWISVMNKTVDRTSPRLTHLSGEDFGFLLDWK